MKKIKITPYVLIAIVPILLSGSCKKLNMEHEEAKNVNIKDIDFSVIADGDYDGYYAGGMYQWRENKCLVTVNAGRVSDIKLLSSKAEYKQEFLDTLYMRVIKKQSLQVDAVSGATLDSKACLKAIEDALIKVIP